MIGILYKKENFTETEETFARKLIIFLKLDSTYVDYLNFLNTNRNTFEKLISKDTYNKLKTNPTYENVTTYLN